MPKLMTGLLPRLLAVGLSLSVLAGGTGPTRAGEPFRVKLEVTADEAMKVQVIRHLHHELGLLEDVVLVVDEPPDFVLSVVVEGTDDTLSARPQYAVSVVVLETGNGAACYAALERCQCAKGFNPETPGDTGFLPVMGVEITVVVSRGPQVAAQALEVLDLVRRYEGPVVVVGPRHVPEPVHRVPGQI
jgi:hypothetical protein